MWYHIVPTGLFLAVVTSFKEIQISDNDPSVSIGISKEFLPPKDARTDEKFENMKYKIKKYESYEIPTPQIELLQPKGFRISIPDERKNLLCVNIDFSINKRLKRNKEYDFYRGSTHVTAEKGVLWSMQNDTVDLREGDVVIYAALAIHIRGGVYETDEHFAIISLINGIPKVTKKGIFKDEAEFTDG